MSEYLINVPVEDLVEDPRNERANVDDGLDELVESIKERGILEPLRVYRDWDKGLQTYRVSSGHRRLAAAKRAGLDQLPCMVCDDRGIDTARDIDRLTTNIQRQDLAPLEEARSFKRILEESDGAITQDALARCLGKSQSYVANRIRLLDLPALVQTLIEEAKLSAGHGIALLACKEPTIRWRGEIEGTAEEWIEEMAKRAVANSMSVRSVEEEVKRHDADTAFYRTQAEEQKKRDAEQSRRAAAAAAAQAAGEDVEWDAKIALYNEQVRTHNALTQENKEKRREIWQRLRTEALGYDPTEGPSLNHIRLVGMWAADKLYGYGERGEKPKAKFKTAVEKARSADQIIRLLADAVTGEVGADYYFTGPDKQGVSPWAWDRWKLTDTFKAACEEAGLVDTPYPEYPQRPEPPKTEEPAA